MRSLLHQIPKFLLVGGVASGTHWATAVACVDALDANPLIANVAGWLLAFVVSFSGHHRFTFRHDAIAWSTAACRFFIVSAAGFALNQSALAYLLTTSRAPYDLLLAFTLLAVAMSTFIISRLWAFRRPVGA